MKHYLLLLFFYMFSTWINAQQTIPLYPGATPNSIIKPDIEKRTELGNGNYFLEFISRPTLSIYLPEDKKEKTPAIIICPGGGYWGLAIKHEGIDPAEAFQKMGIASIILKYRMPGDSIMPDKTIGPLQDLQEAIKTVRLHGLEWNIDTLKIGVLGFSAGGHLAASAGTHFNDPVIKNEEHINLRPNFMILIYPVISFTDSLTHQGTRDNLLGKNPSEEKVRFFSNELQVNGNTPPAFLVHAGNDKVVNVDNSISFYQALQRNGVDAELLIYPKGGHGFGLNNITTSDKWIDHCKEWLISSGWLKN